jgi:hypothetical protein
MATSILDTVLLFALPASGKSEVRTYMASLTAKQCREDFHMGPTLQLDDYPYVHLMHRIDDELKANGWKYAYYAGPTRPFQDPWEWAALIELLNEDYDALLGGRSLRVKSAGQWMMDRFDQAHAKVGLPEPLGDVPYRIRKRVADAIEKECAAELKTLNQTCGQNRKGKTIVIEAARGGANGSAFPITTPRGYLATFQQLSPQILERASVLYVWVDPEESRRKNIERGRPDGQGSILHHSVPMEVMLGEYGCDDMAWLIGQSDRPNTVKVERIVEDRTDDGSSHYSNRVYYLPVGRFDNRKDKTSFIRNGRENWKPKEIQALHGGLKEALTQIATASRV